MSHEKTTAEIGAWDRWFAAEFNNQAWTLAEKPGRTPGEIEEMLRAAYAAAAHWERVGTELNRMRAEMLLGLVEALAGNGVMAMRYAQRSHHYILSHESADWEIAFAHAVLANAARACGDLATYRAEYEIARRCGEAIGDTEERRIFNATFGQMAAPRGVLGI